MENEIVAPQSEVRFGSIVGTAMRLMGSRLGFFLGVALVCAAPQLVTDLTFPSFDTSYGGTEIRWSGVILDMFMFHVTMGLSASILVYTVMKELQGQRVSAGDAIRKGFAYGIPAVFTVLMVTIVSLGGLLLFVIPGWILGAMLWVAVPVAILEKRGVFASLSRSAKLTDGYRWTFFGINVAFGIGIQVVSSVLMAAIENVPVMTTALWFCGVLYACLHGLMYSVAYSMLVTAKEGGSIEKIAEVFD